MISLAGKVSLITGGSRGIGAASALLLARAGSDIVLNYVRDNEHAGAVAKAIRETGRNVIVHQGNIADTAEADNLIDRSIVEFGKIDILVNNAGIWTYGAIGSMDETTWDATIDLNLKGVFIMCNALVPHFRRGGGGRIITIASTAGQRGEAFHSHYAASKGGVIAFSKSLAAELGPDNILVNVVSPGWVETDMTELVMNDVEARAGIEAAIPLRRVATPDDVAGAVLFLASDLARHITGATINVNGGSVLS